MGFAAGLPFEPLEDVEAVDNYTVEFTTSEPFAPLPAHMAHVSAGIMSPAAIEADANDEGNLDAEPVGTGPFAFENWEEGSEIVKQGMKMDFQQRL